MVLSIINSCIGTLFGVCYLYQLVFLIISYVKRQKKYDAKKINKIAVLIAARNEEHVITKLIDCLHRQDYPKDSLGIFVVADNCTDKTAEVSKAAGAVVYERFNTDFVGKGYAIDFLIKKIAADFGTDAYDAYLIFDADNLAEENFVTEINKTLSQGYDCVSSYRNSKNYGDNWLAAGQGMCFMRDLILLNRARMTVGGCCFVAGTGFAFTRRLCESFGGGWPFHTLTEDGEFTTYNAIEGNRMGYCETARFYDEQPTSIGQSWNQRLRWCKGYLQIIRGYYGRLIKGIFSKKFISCFDMTMCMAPAYILSILAVFANITGAVIDLCLGVNPLSVLISLAVAVGSAYSLLLLFSLCLTVSEWRRLCAPAYKKILYMFTFPVFMFTFIPICFTALFKKTVKWTPIVHKPGVSIDEIKK